jgi:hypothetical protein
MLECVNFLPKNFPGLARSVKTGCIYEGEVVDAYMNRVGEDQSRGIRKARFEKTMIKKCKIYERKS